ncbi:MAG: hypothetical protein ACRC8A_10270 [Microcoleaceae cyanobacterium]
MDAFQPVPPEWTTDTVHASQFCCPDCNANSLEAKEAWINRRSPVYGESHRRKWQEFYLCCCGCAWWGWSTDRLPSSLSDRSNDRTEAD